MATPSHTSMQATCCAEEPHPGAPDGRPLMESPRAIGGITRLQVCFGEDPEVDEVPDHGTVFVHPGCRAPLSLAIHIFDNRLSEVGVHDGRDTGGFKPPPATSCSSEDPLFI